MAGCELGKQALTRHQIFQHYDCGLPSLQNDEKYVSVIYKPPVHGIVQAARIDSARAGTTQPAELGPSTPSLLDRSKLSRCDMEVPLAEFPSHSGVFQAGRHSEHSFGALLSPSTAKIHSFHTQIWESGLPAVGLLPCQQGSGTGQVLIRGSVVRLEWIENVSSA